MSDLLEAHATEPVAAHSRLLRRATSVAVIRRCVGRPFLWVNERVWNRLPKSARKRGLLLRYGRLLQLLVRLRSTRRQYHGTYFLRNRPELDQLRAIAEQRETGATLRIAVLACSNGAEVYSIVWALRSARPDLKLVVHAVDIAGEVVEIAKSGRYSTATQELIGSAIFERLADAEKRQMFDSEGEWQTVRPWLRESIEWHVGDAADPLLQAQLGPMDIAVANKFLCHMTPPDAERCLRSIARVVRPGGHLFVSGVDLDVRTKVARDLNWIPVEGLIEEIHNGDPSVLRDWPWRYWGLEPFDGNRPDWKIRYASVFRLGVPHVEAIRLPDEDPALTLVPSGISEFE